MSSEPEAETLDSSAAISAKPLVIGFAFTVAPRSTMVKHTKLVVLCKLSNDVTIEKQNAELSQDDFANGVYSSLSEKAKEVVPQVEQLLNGLSYKDAETMMFAILSKIRSCSLIAV